VNADGKLIGETWTFKLVGGPIRIWILPWLFDRTVRSINRKDKDCSIVKATNGPCNLLSLEASNGADKVPGTVPSCIFVNLPHPSSNALCRIERQPVHCHEEIFQPALLDASQAILVLPRFEIEVERGTALRRGSIPLPPASNALLGLKILIVSKASKVETFLEKEVLGDEDNHDDDGRGGEGVSSSTSCFS
jgi:hypothetical protein